MFFSYNCVQNVNIDGIKSKKISEEILDNIYFKERSSFNEIFLNDDKINLEKILVILFKKTVHHLSIGMGK